MASVKHHVYNGKTTVRNNPTRDPEDAHIADAGLRAFMLRAWTPFHEMRLSRGIRKYTRKQLKKRLTA